MKKMIVAKDTIATKDDPINIYFGEYGVETSVGGDLEEVVVNVSAKFRATVDFEWQELNYERDTYELVPVFDELELDVDESDTIDIDGKVYVYNEYYDDEESDMDELRVYNELNLFDDYQSDESIIMDGLKDYIEGFKEEAEQYDEDTIFEFTGDISIPMNIYNHEDSGYDDITLYWEYLNDSTNPPVVSNVSYKKVG